MKNTLLLLLATSVGLVSCGKFDKDEKDNMIAYAARYGQTVTVPSTDYEVVEVAELVRLNDAMPYTQGEVKYMVDGNEVAKINYSHGDDYHALLSKEGNSETVSLGENKEDKWDYKKVIVEPLIYSEECGYVVSGVIKFFKDEKWVATLDYGDGSCDDLIAKHTEDYKNYMFSMDDYPEWNK
ncbi:MAG TPA: hypothetical protein DCR04_13075 [Flavobacteriales bacterium]|nr:hypothetical protein [Flavobacteriales bacterium]